MFWRRSAVPTLTEPSGPLCLTVKHRSIRSHRIQLSLNLEGLSTFMPPIFRAYYEHGYFAYRNIIENCIKTILSERLVRTDAPPSSEVSLTRQGNRLMAHIVNFQPQRRGKTVEHIEDAYPMMSMSQEVRSERAPKRIYLAPSNEELEFGFEGGHISCDVPEVLTHQIVVFDLE